MLRYIAKRVALLVPQLLLITLIVFALVAFAPGDPGRAQLGPQASDEAVAEFNASLGLDRPWVVQYVLYIGRIVRGDFGMSLSTGQPVLSDIAQRAPATIELITIAFLIIVAIAIPLGVAAGFSQRKVGRCANSSSYAYSLMSGAVPDFWFGLILIFLFTYTFKVAAQPIGQLDLTIVPPPTVTNSVFIDSLLAGNFAAFLNHLSHLVLPVAVLVFINAAPILRMTRNNVAEALASGYIRLAAANGARRSTIVAYSLRLSLPPVITLAGVWYTVLISAAVLTETVFGWGGLGQYIVQAVLGADWVALEGVVLITALVSLVIYLVVDIVHAAIDPRVRVRM